MRAGPGRGGGGMMLLVGRQPSRWGAGMCIDPSKTMSGAVLSAV